MVEEFSMRESYKSSNFLDDGIMLIVVRTEWSGIPKGVIIGLRDC
jgi:hypothetical protein